MFNDIAKLVSVVITYDDVGNTIETPTEKEVFVQSKSVRAREFYEAATVDMKPDLVLVLSDYYDYDGEKLVEYNDKVYDVIRTYVNKNRLELTLTERITHGDITGTNGSDPS